MFGKKFRLQKKYQFNYVYRVGKSFSNKDLILYYSPSNNKNVKVGISVSKKVGNAVTRNLVKRRLRECIKPYLTHIKPNYNVIIVAKNSANQASFKTLSSSITLLLQKADLIKD